MEEMKALSLLKDAQVLEWFNEADKKDGWELTEDITQHEGHTTKYLRRTWSKPLVSGLGKRFWTATVAQDRKTGNQSIFHFGPYDRLNHELDKETGND